MGDSMISEGPDPCFVFQAKDMPQKSFEKLHQFFLNQVLCDVEIRTGWKSIKCHKIVLACCSPYFHAMFTSSLAESHQKIITICDISEGAMEQLINFAYTATVDLTVDNVQSLLHAASVLQLDTLAQACSQFMRKHLHPNNTLGIWQFAEHHGLTDLMKYSDSFIRRNFGTVTASDEFLDMGEKYLEELVASSDLCVENETQVFEAVLRWIKHDVERRKQFLPNLLSKVRLPLLPPAYLKGHVDAEELIRNSLECRDLLDEARDHQLWKACLLPGVTPARSERTRPRKSYAGVLFCVGGRGSNGEPHSSVECYSCLHNKWFHVVEMGTKRRHVGLVSVGGRVYAAGGCDEKLHLSSTEVYDPAINSWLMLSSMNIPRRGVGLCSLGGPIYAVGGLDDLNFFATVERYDLDCDNWTMVAPMNSCRGGVAVAILKGCIFAAGGNSGQTTLNSCERYDPHLNKWTYVSPMNQRRAGAGAASLNGFLFVVGGFENNVPLNTVERYDPELDRWILVTPMSVNRGGVGVAELGGRMFAVGGHNGNSYLSSVEVYDPLTDRWEAAADINLPRAGAGIAHCQVQISSLFSMNEKRNQGVVLDWMEIE